MTTNLLSELNLIENMQHKIDVKLLAFNICISAFFPQICKLELVFIIYQRNLFSS